MLRKILERWFVILGRHALLGFGMHERRIGITAARAATIFALALRAANNFAATAKATRIETAVTLAGLFLCAH